MREERGRCSGLGRRRENFERTNSRSAEFEPAENFDDNMGNVCQNVAIYMLDPVRQSCPITGHGPIAGQSGHEPTTQGHVYPVFNTTTIIQLQQQL